jgi:hypothetical protein
MVYFGSADCAKQEFLDQVAFSHDYRLSVAWNQPIFNRNDFNRFIRRNRQSQ